MAHIMAGTRYETRRIVVETWAVYRRNPATGDIETFELTCERGTFLNHYRMLGHVDAPVLTDQPGDVEFDPMEDDWYKELVGSYTETVERRIR